MTSIFDGRAGYLNDVFGGPVTHIPVIGLSRILQGRFRREPVTVDDGDGGSLLFERPSLAVQKADAATISNNDLIQPADGKTYRVMNRHPSGSPASDAFVYFELEEDST
jgi:hypothetical protein